MGFSSVEVLTDLNINVRNLAGMCEVNTGFQ